MTDLYRLLLCFRDGKNLQFSYKSEGTSKAAYVALKCPAKLSTDSVPPGVEITDDYGNMATIVVADVSAFVHTHVNEDMNAQHDLTVLNAHGQIKLDKRLESDPAVREQIAKMQMRQRLMGGGMNGASGLQM